MRKSISDILLSQEEIPDWNGHKVRPSLLLIQDADSVSFSIDLLSHQEVLRDHEAYIYITSPNKGHVATSVPGEDYLDDISVPLNRYVRVPHSFPENNHLDVTVYRTKKTKRDQDLRVSIGPVVKFGNHISFAGDCGIIRNKDRWNLNFGFIEPDLTFDHASFSVTEDFLLS